MTNFSLSSEGPGRGGVLLVYGLYIARFFTGISLLAGVILAYVLKGSSHGVVRTHPVRAHSRQSVALGQGGESRCAPAL